MKDILHFCARLPVIELENIYRQRYQGHEADIRFDPMLENTLEFDLRIRVPHMLSVDEEWKKEVEANLREMAYRLYYDIAREAASRADKMRASP